MRYFRLEELVDKRTFEHFGYSAWALFPPNSLEMLDNLREFIGVPLTCNDWFTGGQFQFRGYRPSWCNVGAKNSYHRKGLAFDFDVEGMSAEEARQKIVANQDSPLLKLIQRMEADVNWLHVDIGRVPDREQRIYLFKG